MRKPYPTYKNSGLEWIGKVPLNWDLLKIKNICLIGKGQGLSKDSIDAEGKNKCILYGELFTVYKDLNTLNNVISRTNESCYVISKGNEILIPGSTTTTGIDLSNAKFLPQKDILLGGDIIILNPRKSNLYIQDYISFFLSYVSTPEFIVGARGVTIYHIYPKQIREMYIAYPPIHEQKKIVNYLYHKINLIENLIEKTEQKIELLKEKRTSLINHCVTKGLNPDVEMKDSGIEWIGKIPKHWSLQRGSIIGKYSKGSGISKDEVKESGIPCIRYGEIYTTYDRLVYSPKSFVSDDDNNKVKVSKGSVFLTGSGETVEDIGKSVVYMGESDIYVGGDIIIINLKDGILPLFISYLINAECIRFQKSMFGKGEIIVHIYPKNIREIIFCIPPISEQKQIVEYLDLKTKKIDTMIEKENSRIELLKEYRQSLILEAVTGKIDVRDEVAI